MPVSSALELTDEILYAVLFWQKYLASKIEGFEIVAQ